MVAVAPPSTTVLARMNAYADGVLSGEIIAGTLVRQACERHQRDLTLGSARGLWFDEGAAEHAVAFIQQLRHSKGEWRGRHFIMNEWQIFIVGSVFGWMRADGYRRFRSVHMEVARKNGKTTLMAAIGLYLMMADSEGGAEVYAAATKRDQARLCWDEAVQMVKATPAFTGRVDHARSSLNLSYPALNSKFEPLGRDADTVDGLNPHGLLIDELHAHPNRDLVDVLETALGARRQPLSWKGTTAGFNQNGIWWQMRTYAIRVVEGAVDDDAQFVYIASLDTEDDWRDPSVWIKGNPNLGVSVYPEGLASECKVAIEQPDQQPAFITKRMNVPTTGVSRWLDIRQWDACDGEPQVAPGAVGFVGIDMASTIDLSAAVALFPAQDGSYDLLARFWRPRDTIDEAEKRDRVPYRQWAREGWLTLVDGTMMDPADITDDILDWSSKWAIKEYPFDRYNAASAGARIEGAGGVAVQMAQGAVTYSEPCHTLTGLLASGRIRHGGNPILRWMASQVMVETGANDSIRPYKPKGSGIRDDGITALLMALARALVHRDAPPPPQPSVLVLDLWS